MKKLILITVLTLMTGVFGNTLSAQNVNDSPLYFGPEFTFQFSADVGDFLILITRMHDHLVDGQPEGAKFEQAGHQFLSPNGWSFIVSTDPGVIEVTVSPMTVEEWEIYANDIQDAIFTSAANLGMFPQDYLGGGHISVDIAHFDNNPLLLRNFLADLINHNELFMGALNYDVQNAASPLLYEQETLKRRNNIFKNFDDKYHHRSSPKLKRRLLNEFLNDLRETYFFGHSFFHQTFAPAVRIQNSIDDNGQAKGRIEIRGIRPQKSANMFLRQIRLLKGRIEYLKKFNEPIPIKKQVGVVNDLDLWDLELDDKYYLWNPPVDPMEAIANFHRYVTESGENWADHQDYLWPKWISEAYLAEFNESLGCEDLLN